MELINFKIADDCIAVESEGHYYDLHNNFDFESACYKVSTQEIVLSWEKSSGDWVEEGNPQYLSINFSGVSLFKCKERAHEVPTSEDACLDFLGFIYNELIEDLSGFTQAEPVKGMTHLNVSFNSGIAMKISANRAELFLNKKRAD